MLIYLGGNKNGFADTKLYFEHIEKLKDILPLSVYHFAIDENNYNLRSHHSLHDAWLLFFCVKEVRAESDNWSSSRKIVIESCYEGPYADCKIYLNYESVLSFNLKRPNKMNQYPDHLPLESHGDLLMHEIDYEDGLVIHRILFDSDAFYEIKCTNIIHTIEPIKNM